VKGLLTIELLIKNVAIWTEVIRSYNRDIGLATIACNNIEFIANLDQINYELLENHLLEQAEISGNFTFEPANNCNLKSLLNCINDIVLGLEAAILRLEILYPGDPERFYCQRIHISGDLLTECMTCLAPISA
jgi:hypothetical protein